MKTLVDVLLKTSAWFKERGIPSSRLDAELLLGHVLGLDRVQLYLNFERPLTDDELERIRVVVRRRSAREPLAWIVEKKEFYNRDFIVRPGVLVPRPDTETLIEAALKLMPDADPLYVADIGSGSGCIGLTLAAERPGIRLYAIDRSPEALACTQANIVALDLKSRAVAIAGDLLGNFPAERPIDWVVSNPPYIADLSGLAPEVRDHEPRLALDGGPDGLAVYRRLIPQASKRVRQGLIVEVGAGQAPSVATLMSEAGLSDVQTFRDLAGTERVVAGLIKT